VSNKDNVEDEDTFVAGVLFTGAFFNTGFFTGSSAQLWVLEVGWISSIPLVETPFFL